MRSSLSFAELEAHLSTLQVNSTFSLVAHSLLYGSPSVSVRSGGRTFLLARTLSSNPSLASLVRTLVAKSENDQGHPESLVAILRSTTLASVTLSAVFFREVNSELYSALQAQQQLARFSYGFHGVSSPLADVAPLLQSWPNLTRLTLKHVGASSRDEQVGSLASQARTLRRWGPPPSYRLNSVEVHNCRIFELAGWPLATFDWLLGSSRHSLTSLTLIEFDALFSLDELFTLLTTSHSTSHTLQRLTIRNFRNSSSTRISFHDDFSPDLPPPFDPNSLSIYFPSLTYLSLAQNDDETCFSTPRPSFLPPPQLVQLELYEDLFLLWGILRTVETGTGEALRRLRTVGPFASDPDVQELKRACGRRGIECEVKRSF